MSFSLYPSYEPGAKMLMDSMNITGILQLLLQFEVKC